MEKVGVSFYSTLTTEELKAKFIQPLRATIERDHTGIYSNHLRQIDPEESGTVEHLLIFEVHDFKEGLRVLRLELSKLGDLAEFRFHNLNPSEPSY